MNNERSGRVTAVIMREINRILGDKVYLFIGIIAPLIGFSLITLIFSASVPRKLPVAIVDQDHTSLSRKMIRMIEATPVASPDNSGNSLEEARLKLVSGETSAIVVIPSGTEKNILRGQHADIAIYLNNVYLIKAGLLKSGIQKTIATLSTGIKLQTHMIWGETQPRSTKKSLCSASSFSR